MAGKTTFEILLTDVRITAHHGVMAQERKVGNEFAINLTVEIPVSGGAARDELEGTVNYADLYKIIKEEMNQPSALLEHVCLRIAMQISEHYPELIRGEIAITKLSPPITGMCGNATVKLNF